ncbi:MAG: sugar ABC transporter permease [Sphaerochaetaceae bacterium]
MYGSCGASALQEFFPIVLPVGACLMQQRPKTIVNATSKDKTFPRLMILPTIIVLLVMTTYPLIFTVFYSFTDYNYLKGGVFKFIGMQNYDKLLHAKYFQIAVLNTIKFTILAVFFEMVFGILMAIFVKSLNPNFQHVMRVLLLLPYLLPTATVSTAWKMMLSQNYGIVNQLLATFHLPVHNWFMETETAFKMILLIDVWQNIPFVFLLLYACLQTVPNDQYEAALIDGANSLQLFWHITIPNIKEGIALCALLRTIDTFRLFDKVNILTGGGPAGTTSTITQFIYNYGIKSLKFGYGSAGALLMTILVLGLSVVYIKKAIK